MSSSLSRGFYSGLIAGMVGGTVIFLYVNLIGERSRFTYLFVVFQIPLNRNMSE